MTSCVRHEAIFDLFIAFISKQCNGEKRKKENNRWRERERERRGKSIIIAKYTTYLTFPSTLPYANASDPLVPLTVFIDLLPILL